MQSEDPNPWNQLLETAKQSLDKHKIPGISLGILKDGEIRTACFGVTNLETQVPVSEETVFQIGSITKTFTATLAMQMVEEGKIDLDTPLRAYLPKITFADPLVTENVTAYHLLTHSGGWDGDFFIDTGEGADALDRFVARMPEREQISPLGKYVSYNNAGFVILGHLLEKISGESLETLLRERIFKPVGIQGFVNANEVISHSFAVGHHEGEVARPWYLPRLVLASGAILMNTQNLLKYAKVYLNEGKIDADQQLLSRDSINRMFTPQLPIWEPDGTSVGLSWMRRDLDGLHTISHGGATNGQIAYLAMVPGRQFALAFLSNAGSGRAAATEILNQALESYFDVSPSKPEAINSTVNDLKPFAGAYRKQSLEMHTNLVDDILVGIYKSKAGFPTENEPPEPPTPPFTLQRCGENRLLGMDGVAVENAIDILRNDDGEVDYCRIGLRLMKFSSL